jgi:hypothetical protein
LPQRQLIYSPSEKGDNQNMSPKSMFVAISIYQYLMLILTSIFLLIIPVMESRQYFDSLFVDIVARCILWLYFVVSYWSIATAIKNGLRKKKNLFFVSRKGVVTFVLLGISAIITSAFLSILTKWSLVAFAPEIPSAIINVIALGNGVVYATLGMSQYYFLPVE